MPPGPVSVNWIVLGCTVLLNPTVTLESVGTLV